MERSRHRRSTRASSLEGVTPIQKFNSVRLSPGYALQIDGSTRDDMLMVERGQSSSVRATERPMAKLLAEKMFKEPESKSGSPSGIARLMRREGLNSLWNVKQKTRLPEGHRQNNVSINIEPDRQLYGGLYKRRSPMEKQQFNAYGDPQASHFVNNRRSSRWSASSIPSNSEMGLTRQKIDTKHLSFGELINENFEDSIVLDDPLDLQYSKDILMNYAWKMNSLYANQRVNPRSSHPERLDGLLLEPHNRYGARLSHRISNIQSKEKRKDMFPRPIAFPRPDLRNMRSVAESGSSSYPSHDYIPNFRKIKEYPSVGGAEEMSWRTNGPYYDAVFSKPNSNGTRKLAREITRQISGDENYPGFREYMGDKSLYDARRSDCNREPEMFKRSFKNSSVDDNTWGRHPSSGSVLREGNKRLPERWKITHKYRDLEIVGDPSMLGEVLAIADEETRSKNYAYKGNDRSSARLGIGTGSSILGGSLGITSRTDPWNEIQRTSSRSRSLPPIGGRVHNRDACHDVFSEEKHVMQGDHGRRRVFKGYPIHKNLLVSQGSKSSSKKSLPFTPIRIKESESSFEATFEIPMEPNVRDFREQQLRSQMAEKDDCSGGPISDIMIDKQEITASPSECSLLHPKHSSEDIESCAADDEEDLHVQELHHGPPEENYPSLKQPGAETLFSDSFKDAGRASPISVFEVPYVEDASSSSESFGRVSAELNELCMKVQLLELEPGAYDEIFTLITNGEDVAYLSSSAESWEVSYTLDVLIQSGFQDFGFNMFQIMWDCPDHPLDPTLFDTLEKKYDDDMPELRLERILLFDQINSALSEIFQKHVDLHPWLMPKSAGSLSTWAKDARQSISQKTVHWQVTERIVLGDMQLGDPLEEIALIGNIIEELLLNDIITEFLCE